MRVSDRCARRGQALATPPAGATSTAAKYACPATVEDGVGIACAIACAITAAAATVIETSIEEAATAENSTPARQTISLAADCRTIPAFFVLAAKVVTTAPEIFGVFGAQLADGALSQVGEVGSMVAVGGKQALGAPRGSVLEGRWKSRSIVWGYTKRTAAVRTRWCRASTLPPTASLLPGSMTLDALRIITITVTETAE